MNVYSSIMTKSSSTLVLNSFLMHHITHTTFSVWPSLGSQLNISSVTRCQNLQMMMISPGETWSTKKLLEEALLVLMVLVWMIGQCSHILADIVPSSPHFWQISYLERRAAAAGWDYLILPYTLYSWQQQLVLLLLLWTMFTHSHSISPRATLILLLSTATIYPSKIAINCSWVLIEPGNLSSQSFDSKLFLEENIIFFV